MSLGSQAESEPLPRGDWVRGLETWNVRRGAVNTSREQLLPTASLEMQRYQPLSLAGELAETPHRCEGISDPISQHSYPHALAVPFPDAAPWLNLPYPTLPVSLHAPTKAVAHTSSALHQLLWCASIPQYCWEVGWQAFP